MSPIVIKLIATICIVVLVSPLVILYVSNRALLRNYDGLVENVIAGVISGLLITWLLDIILGRRQQITQEKVARIGLAEISQRVNRMVALFGTIYKAASDGHKPSTIDELFNAKAANLLSLHLAIDANVASNDLAWQHAIKGISWQDHITAETSLILNELASLQDRYQAFLPESALISLAELRNNTLLKVFSHLNDGKEMDVAQHISRPVINFTPLDALTSLMDDILLRIKVVQKESIRLKIPGPHFPTFDFRDNVAPKLGSARYDGNPGPACIISESPPSK